MAKPTKAGRAVSYVRQSKFREESISLEVQEDGNEQYAKQKRYTIVETCPDPGVSGLDFDKRPGIKRAIELIEAGEAQVLIVYRLNRLSRHDLHQAAIIDRIEKAGGRVESVMEQIDATEAGGRFARGVLLKAASFESDVKSEQWLEAQARRVALGLPSGGRAPFGYRHTGIRDTPPEPHPQHAPILREMYERYLRGHGIGTIARWLNDELKVTPTPKRRKGDSEPTPHQFTTGTVMRLLDSGFAAGYLTLHDPECDAPRRPDDQHTRTCARRAQIRGRHKPIIAEETWREYLRVRASRKTVHPRSRQPHWYLGGTLTACGLCGGTVHISSYTNPLGQVRCSNNARRRTCAGVWVNRRWLEWHVMVWLSTRVEEWTSRVEELVGTDDERERLTRDLDAARAEEVKIQRGLRNLQSLVASGDLSDDDYRERKREAEANLAKTGQVVEEIRARIDALNPDGDAYERLSRLLGYELPAWAGPGDPPDDFWSLSERFQRELAPEEWNLLLRRVIRKITVHPDGITIEPLRGAVHRVSRNVPKVEKPAGKPTKRGRRGATRDARTGRFAREWQPAG